ncbi:hypothetical protein PE36_07707 [Moritella sp. PE36]|nr:hypothetical protein PE36_07707 [Moritella sp. PE36]
MPAAIAFFGYRFRLHSKQLLPIVGHDFSLRRKFTIRNNPFFT